MIKDGSFTKLPTTIDDFFHYWVLFTRPFHNLRNKEMITFAALLKKRYELSEMIKDDALLDMNLLADIHKKAIAEEIGMSSNGVECMLSKLRKTGIIKDNRINKRFIPNLDLDAKSFNMIVVFDIQNG